MASSCFWKETRVRWTVAALTAVAMVFDFKHGMIELEHLWSYREEYSHAYFLPLIAIFLVWQKKDELRKLPLQGSWAGLRSWSSACCSGAPDRSAPSIFLSTTPS